MRENSKTNQYSPPLMIMPFVDSTLVIKKAEAPQGSIQAALKGVCRAPPDFLSQFFFVLGESFTLASHGKRRLRSTVSKKSCHSLPSSHRRTQSFNRNPTKS